MHNRLRIMIRWALLTDLNACHDIESKSYGSEGASKEQIQRRILQYPVGFYVATVNDKIVGLLNSGCTDNPDLSNEEIKSLIGHTHQGRYLVVFSLATHLQGYPI